MISDQDTWARFLALTASCLDFKVVQVIGLKDFMEAFKTTILKLRRTLSDFRLSNVRVCKDFSFYCLLEVEQAQDLGAI